MLHGIDTMGSTRTVDIRKLTEFLAPGAFMRIDPAIEPYLLGKEETCERVEGCVLFCWHLQNTLSTTDDELDKQRKYLRAALAEYASIDEAAKLDLGDAAPKMIDLDDPRVHVVRLLRHANVHLSASDIRTIDKPASWNGPNGRQDFTFSVNFIPDIECIRATDQATKYAPSDLAAMINWIDQEQRRWGIENVIIRAAEQYLTHLPL
jgi:hypothetical protein